MSKIKNSPLFEAISEIAMSNQNSYKRGYEEGYEEGVRDTWIKVKKEIEKNEQVNDK